MANIKPLEDKIVVQASEAETTTASGIVIPVWELPKGSEAEDVEEAAKAFWPLFSAELESTQPLDANERRARAGIVSRQVTLR